MNKYSAELNEVFNRITDLHLKVSGSSQPSLMDLHLLGDYVRKYYDLLTSADVMSGTPAANVSVFEIKQIVKDQPAATAEAPVAEQAPPVPESKMESLIDIIAPQVKEEIKAAGHATEKFKEYTSVGDRFSKQDTIANRFPDVEQNAVTGQYKATRLADLNDAIGINERFAFANVFMNGDINAFYSALAMINSKQNFEEAFNFFRTEVVEKYNVDKNNRLYREFTELLQRRFMK